MVLNPVRDEFIEVRHVSGDGLLRARSPECALGLLPNAARPLRHGVVMERPVTTASVLCAKRMP